MATGHSASQSTQEEYQLLVKKAAATAQRVAQEDSKDARSRSLSEQTRSLRSLPLDSSTHSLDKDHHSIQVQSRLMEAKLRAIEADKGRQQSGRITLCEWNNNQRFWIV